MKSDNKQKNDAYFTKPDVANDCIGDLFSTLTKLNVNPNDYTYLEPSAGSGAFFNLLPDPKIGLDLEPRHPNVIQQDFLDYIPDPAYQYIAVGNPPFTTEHGCKGDLALQFINKCADFADVIGMILPACFNSDGMGAAGTRVHKRLKLDHTKILDPKSFVTPDGKEIEINCIWQVWSGINHDLIITPPERTCNDFVEIYSVSHGDGGNRNTHIIGKCDRYLDASTHKKIYPYKSYEELTSPQGWGILVINAEHEQDILDLIDSTDWNAVARVSTNGAKGIRKGIIQQVITNAGYYD